ncbi:hypothetical protein pb186bvf_017475 [Paramecium bursaria]
MQSEPDYRVHFINPLQLYYSKILQKIDEFCLKYAILSKKIKYTWKMTFKKQYYCFFFS